MLNYFPVGVLAGTEQNSGILFLDDLSHHMFRKQAYIRSSTRQYQSFSDKTFWSLPL